jgi:hypothetical protein
MTSDGATGHIALTFYRLTATALSLIILTGLTIFRFYESFTPGTLLSWHPFLLTFGVSQYKNNFGVINLLCSYRLVLNFTVLILCFLPRTSDVTSRGRRVAPLNIYGSYGC